MFGIFVRPDNTGVGEPNAGGGISLGQAPDSARPMGGVLDPPHIGGGGAASAGNAGNGGLASTTKTFRPSTSDGQTLLGREKVILCHNYLLISTRIYLCIHRYI